MHKAVPTSTSGSGLFPDILEALVAVIVWSEDCWSVWDL